MHTVFRHACSRICVQIFGSINIHVTQQKQSHVTSPVFGTAPHAMDFAVPSQPGHASPPPPPGHLVSQVLDGNPYTKFLRKDCDFPVDLEVDLGIRSKQG